MRIGGTLGGEKLQKCGKKLGAVLVKLKKENAVERREEYISLQQQR